MGKPREVGGGTWGLMGMGIHAFGKCAWAWGHMVGWTSFICMGARGRGWHKFKLVQYTIENMGW